MALIDRNQLVDQVRSWVKGGGTIPPSGTSGFTWGTIIIGVLVIAGIIAAIVYGVPWAFGR